VAQKDIQSVLHEDRVFPPSAEFKKHATLQPKDLAALHKKAAEDYVGFWADLAVSEIHWQRPFSLPLDDTDAPNYRWFTDGQLNVSYNCLDVHLGAAADKLAIIFEGEPGDVRKLTYAELHAEVCRFANALKATGINKGDRVVIYMPLIPEAVIAMQACARIGAVHSVVFGGFSANAVKERIEDAGARLVITADGGWRGGHAVDDAPIDHELLLAGARPIDEADRDLLVGTGFDRIENLRIGDGGRISLTLQQELRLLHAARHIHGQSEQQVDLLGGERMGDLT